jgi:hypothetical protein
VVEPVLGRVKRENFCAEPIDWLRTRPQKARRCLQIKIYQVG